MQPRLLAAVAAMLVTPVSVLFAAETPKAAEPGAPPAVAPAEETVAFLGISAAPAGPALAYQIGLPKGVGLLVERVAPDSPAAKAGLVRYDVLGKLDDQLLIGVHQLRVLVWMHKPGDQVKLTYYRGGKAETTAVTLGSALRSEEREAFTHGRGGPGEHGRPGHFWNHEMRRCGPEMYGMGHHFQEFMRHEAKECAGEHGGPPCKYHEESDR